MPPDTPMPPLALNTPPQYRHLVVRTGTTAGQHDIGQSVGQADVFSDVPYAPSMPQPHPKYRHLVAKSSTTSGQIEIWSAFGSGWPVYVRVNLVPAAAVLPAPWADIKVAAIKKLICYCLQFSIDHL